ncbi:glycosyltransferase [uncultured Subdoligranulum sp.]|uniref:glycosyltransferase family 2 protein n=1 Tax=uncultured Subdoligranulum sp. TaxID=512298 RepID=UPI0025F1429B|nr:glycosyltransferase [uncultured Subdoligranulum sp.]
MGKSPTITIVSTVYNTRPFLEAAVNSILAQTFTDFELLLIDDGSSDGAGPLCDALAARDARIRVFHQPNGGPASARNKGLDNARGQYIGFVDSDDRIEPTMYETLYAALQAPGVRLAACSGDCIDEEDHTIPGRRVAIRQHGVRDAETLLLETFQTGSYYGPLSWNKLFDIRLFRDKGIHYDETMLFGDDASVLHRVFEGERCNCLPDVLYHYRTRAGQITSTATFPARKLDDLRMYWDWLQYFASRPGFAEYRQWATLWYWRVFYQFWCQSGAAGNLSELKPKFMTHKKHLDAVLPDLLGSPLLPTGEKLRAVLFCANPTALYTAATAWGRLAAKREREMH